MLILRRLLGPSCVWPGRRQFERIPEVSFNVPQRVTRRTERFRFLPRLRLQLFCHGVEGAACSSHKAANLTRHLRSSRRPHDDDCETRKKQQLKSPNIQDVHMESVSDVGGVIPNAEAVRFPKNQRQV